MLEQRSQEARDYSSFARLKYRMGLLQLCKVSSIDKFSPARSNRATHYLNSPSFHPKDFSADEAVANFRILIH